MAIVLMRIWLCLLGVLVWHCFILDDDKCVSKYFFPELLRKSSVSFEVRSEEHYREDECLPLTGGVQITCSVCERLGKFFPPSLIYSCYLPWILEGSLAFYALSLLLVTLHFVKIIKLPPDMQLEPAREGGRENPTIQKANLTNR